MVGKDTKIEWATHTFNPWIGCQKVSDGCKFCYAERQMTRKPRWANAWGPPEASVRLKTKTWGNPVKWNREAEARDERYKVFCASLADVFEDNQQVVEWRLDLFRLIKDTPHLDWLVLTKRPEVALYYFGLYGRVPDNIWMGISVEDQQTADERTPELLKIPARVHFLSLEPLLGPVDLIAANGLYNGVYPSIDWVIVGGESGVNRRPMGLEWARDIRDQCREANTPFFFKQVDKVLPIPDDLMIREFPIQQGQQHVV